MSLIDDKCGFDPAFFSVLKKSFATKSTFERHGILLVDEMATRKSLNVKSTNLTYRGLIDFGDEELNQAEINRLRSKRTTEECPTNQDAPVEDLRADHILVLYFQPLYDTYSQPIAVFASTGNVPGIELAKIIIKG